MNTLNKDLGSFINYPQAIIDQPRSPAVSICTDEEYIILQNSPDLLLNQVITLRTLTPVSYTHLRAHETDQ